MQSSYNAGAFYNQEFNKKNKPYGLYDAIDDERTSEIKSLKIKWEIFMEHKYQE